MWRSAALRRWLRLGLTAALLFEVARIISLGEVSAALLRATPGWVALGLGLSTLDRFVASMRLKQLTDVQGLGFGLGRLYEIALRTNFYAFLLPGALAGGPVRWYQLSRTEGSGGRALAVLLFDRYIDTLVLALSGIAAWTLLPEPGSHPAIVAAMALLALGFSVVYAALIAFDVARWVAVLPGPVQLRDRVARWTASAMLCAHQPFARHLALLGLSLLKDAGGVVAVWCFARALGIEIPLAMAWWVRSVALVVTLLPISVGGLGVREITVVVLLAPIGVASADAVALSLLMFLRSLYLALVGGAVVLARGGDEGGAPAETRP